MDHIYCIIYSTCSLHKMLNLESRGYIYYSKAFDVARSRRKAQRLPKGLLVGHEVQDLVRHPVAVDAADALVVHVPQDLVLLHGL